MNVADYLLGCAALALGLLPWIPAARRLSRRMLPDRDVAIGALAAAIIGISGVVVTAELVGICDGFRRWPWAVASGAVAVVVGALGRGPDPRARSARPRLPQDRAARVMLGCVVICIVATSGSLLGRDSAVVATGPLDADSVHYHLTQAAQIVHTHNIDRLHHTASSDGTLYYPYDAELLDAIAMLGPHPDIAVFGLNLLFGWLALLACWVIGSRWSRGAPALAAGAAVISLPIVSQASSGPGLNDLPSMAFLLSAIAMLSLVGLPRAERERNRWVPELVVAGCALGLAAGTKLNVLPIAVLLAFGVVLLARSDRRLALSALALPALLTGGFWYIRNWVEVGSPVPDLNLTVGGHGFHVVPYPEVRPYAFTVAHYLGDAHVIRHWFVPGLHAVWTVLWPVVLLLLLAGLAMSLLADRSVLRRVIGIAIGVGFLAYLVTPTTAIGEPGAPILFATNTRYALPTIVVAVVLFATSPRLTRFATLLTVGFTAMAVVLVSLGSLPQQVDYANGLGIAVALGVVVVAIREILWRGSRATTVLLAATVTVAAVGAGALLQHHYLRTRYAADTDQSRLFRAVGGLTDTRIGVAGHGYAYPFYGKNFDNTVNYVGISQPSHAYDGPMTCAALLGVLTRLHDDYVVVEPLPIEHTERIDTWILAIPGVDRVFSNSAGTVYAMPETIPATSCAP